MLVQQGQHHLCNVGNGASATRATMPLWQQQKCLRIDNGNDAIVTRATTPACQWQQCHCNEGNNIIATMAKMPGLQRRLFISKGNTITMRVTAPAWQHWDAYLLMTATTPLLQGQQYQLNDYASLTMAELPLQQGRQLPLQRWQDAHTSKASASSRQGKQCHRDDGKDACASMMMKTPLQQGQQCQLEDSNNAIAMRKTIPSQIKGNSAIVTRATMPAWWQQRCLHINNGSNTIFMRVTSAITTTAKMPAHQQQWCHSNKGNNTSSTTSNKGNNASLTTVEMPAHQGRQQCHHDVGVIQYLRC
jgi:hypothetical protein